MPASSSRKRRHDEITRSPSPSHSIDSNAPRPKRRRLSLSERRSNRSLNLSPPAQSQPSRFVGDGLDFRTPAMPNTVSRIEPETIDLTAEDSESEDLTSSIFASRATSEEAPALRDEPFQPQHTRAPPFLPAQATNQQIIDLDADYLGGLGGDLQETQGSPDLVITGAREVHNDLPGANPQRRLPTPPVLRFRFGGEGGITQYLRRGREAILGRATAARPEALADVANDYPRFPAWPFPQPNGPAAHRLVVTNHEPDQFNVNLDDYEQVHLNYHEAAFDFGNGRGRVEVRFGNRESSQPEAVEQEPYKEPSPPGPGYSRNLVEDDVAVCPSCNDELAIGGDDTKQQIWISKACGHVYCGDCVVNKQAKNPASKGGKRSKQQKVANQLKNCVAEGCKAKLSGKGAMVQVYL